MDLLGHIKDPLGHKSSKKAKKAQKKKSLIEEVKSIKYTIKWFTSKFLQSQQNQWLFTTACKCKLALTIHDLAFTSDLGR